MLLVFEHGEVGVTQAAVAHFDLDMVSTGSGQLLDKDFERLVAALAAQACTHMHDSLEAYPG